MHEAHLDGAEGDLVLSWRRGGDDAVDEEEGVPAAELDVAGPIDGVWIKAAGGNQMRHDAGWSTRAIVRKRAKTATNSSAHRRIRTRPCGRWRRRRKEKTEGMEP